MLETKRQRGWVLVGIAAVLVVGAVIYALGASRAADDHLDAFTQRAHAAFDGTNGTTIQQMAGDAEVTTWSGQHNPLIEYLSQPGDLSEFSAFPPTARYELPSSWGRPQTAVITWDDDGFTVTRG